MVIKSNFFYLGKANTLIFKSKHSSAIFCGLPLFGRLTYGKQLPLVGPAMQATTRGSLHKLVRPELEKNTNNKLVNKLNAKLLKLKGRTQGTINNLKNSQSNKKIVPPLRPALNFINKILQKIRNIFVFIFTATLFVLMNIFFSELFTRSTASLAQQSNADKYFIIFFVCIIVLILLSLYFILEMLVTIYFIQSHNVAGHNPAYTAGLALATKVVAGASHQQLDGPAMLSPDGDTSSFGLKEVGSAITSGKKAKLEPQKSKKIFNSLPKKLKNSIILFQGACEEDKIKIIKHYILLIIGNIFVIIGYILILTLTQFMFT